MSLCLFLCVVYSWKLSRSKTGLSAAATNRINEIVSREDNLFEGYFEETPQDTNACFHYPVFDQLPDVITLHGPCDTSIRGVANFDAGRVCNVYLLSNNYYNICKISMKLSDLMMDLVLKPV